MLKTENPDYTLLSGTSWYHLCLSVCLNHHIFITMLKEKPTKTYSLYSASNKLQLSYQQCFTVFTRDYLQFQVGLHNS